MNSLKKLFSDLKKEKQNEVKAENKKQLDWYLKWSLLKTLDKENVFEYLIKTKIEKEKEKFKYCSVDDLKTLQGRCIVLEELLSDYENCEKNIKRLEGK